MQLVLDDEVGRAQQPAPLRPGGREAVLAVVPAVPTACFLGHVRVAVAVALALGTGEAEQQARLAAQGELRELVDGADHKRRGEAEDLFVDRNDG